MDHVNHIELESQASLQSKYDEPSNNQRDWSSSKKWTVFQILVGIILLGGSLGLSIWRLQAYDFGDFSDICCVKGLLVLVP